MLQYIISRRHFIHYFIEVIRRLLNSYQNQIISPVDMLGKCRIMIICIDKGSTIIPGTWY